MLVPQLLLETLEDLREDDFKTFKWYLQMQNLDGCKPIPKSRLEKACRTDTVTEIIQSYGEELAVNITVDVLKKIGNNCAADKLKATYADGRAASTSSSGLAPPAAPAAPAAINAQNGSVIFAPTFTGCTSGALNININK